MTSGDRLSSILRVIESALIRIPAFPFALMISAVGVLKSGVLVLGEIPVWNPSSWPHPADFYPFMSYGYRTVGKVLGSTSQEDYLWIAVAAAVTTAIVSAWCLATSLPRRTASWAALLLLAGPWTWTLAGGIGRVDPLVVCGCVILGTKGRRVGWALLGGLLAASGHPELSVLATGALLLVTLSPDLKAWRVPTAITFVAVTTVWVSLRAVSLGDSQQTRDGIFSQYWRKGIATFFVHLPVEVYAGFGLGLILVVWAIFACTGWARVCVCLGSFVVPVMFTALTADQTRVMVLSSVAVLSALVVRYAQEIMNQLGRVTTSPLALTLIAVLILPAIEIQFDHVRSPWESFWPYVQTYLLN